MKHHLLHLIANDRLDQAIELLLKATASDSYIHQQVVTIAASFRNYKAREMTGQLSFEEKNRGTSIFANNLSAIVHTKNDAIIPVIDKFSKQ